MHTGLPEPAMADTARSDAVFAFSRAHRLLKRSDFTACYNAGTRFFSKHFVLFVLFENGRPGIWRLGLAVTRKSGKAVRRNRVKRIVREFFRLHRKHMPERADIVVVPRRNLDPRQLTLAHATREILPVVRSWRTLGGGGGGSPLKPRGASL
jgi:ribonuclease P protein component